MHRFKYLILGTFIFLSGCAYYNTLFNAKRSYNEGIKAMRENPDQNKLPTNAKKNFETTIEKCWKLIELFSEESKYADDALLYICKSEFQVEKYAQSQKHLENFITKYPNSPLIPEAYLWYAKVLLKDEKVDEANEYFIRVIDNAKDSRIRSQANFELGLYAFEKKNYDRAIDYLERALKEKIDNEFKAFLLYYLGEAYYIQNKHEEAIDQYKKVEKYSPALDIDYKSKLNLSRSYTQLGKYNNAYQVLRKALTAPRFAPFVPVLKTAIGENYQAEENLPDAMETYREVIRDRKPGPGTAQAAFNMAKLYEFFYQDIDSAVAYYEQVGKLYGQFDSLDVANNKKVFLSEYKDIKENIRYEERMIYRLTNDNYFRDSLYYAQYIDSVKIASGEIDTTRSDSVLTPEDSLRLALNDSLNNIPGNFGNNFPNNNTNQDSTSSFANNNNTSNNNLPGNNNQGSNPFNNQANNPNNPFLGNNNQNNRDDDDDDKNKKPLEKRKLPEFEFDLMNNRYHLAEFFLLKVEKFDSALVHYNNFLSTYEDSVLSPKALYSMIYIHRTKEYEDLPKVYELEKQILKDYIYSPFASEIMRLKGMAQEEEKKTVKQAEDLANEQFLAAEALYFDGKYQQAIQGYQSVAKLDSTWEVSAKAQFATAWIYEYDLGQVDSALSAYQKVVDNYPSARDYVTIARKKVTPPREDLPPDSTVIAAAQDSLLANQNDDQNQIPIDIQSEDILRDKIRWRNSRSKF